MLDFNKENDSHELFLFREKLSYELNFAQKIFNNINNPATFDDPNIQLINSHKALYNGDMVFCARNLATDLCVFVGDFNTKGLAAVMGAQVISEVFYSMVNKGFSLSAILKEINNKLLNFFPSNLFCQAVCFVVKEREQSLCSWVGGNCLAFTKNKDKHEQLQSHNLPLGIDIKREFEAELKTTYIEQDNLIHIIANSALKSHNQYELLQKNIENLYKNSESDNLFAKIADLVKHIDNSVQDRTLLLEVKAKPCEFIKNKKIVNSCEFKPVDFKMEFTLGPKSLQTFDPLPLLLHMIIEIPGLKEFRSEIYTVLAELYSNALEHGILGLSSKLKLGALGFQNYYQKRKELLDELTTGSIKFTIENIIETSHSKLKLIIEDSGKGFDINSIIKVDENHLFGRGMALVKQICESVEYNEIGNRVQAIYSWN